jgi:glycosyltransferase involved in cell wall biosynthesis
MNFKATVAILSFNSPEEIKNLLIEIEKQTLYKTNQLEILLIDSSNDLTSREDIKKYVADSKLKNLNFLEIDNKDFGHGKTRNFAAKNAKGEYIIFITQDAIPENINSFEKLLHPFSLDSNIKLVTGNQVPHDDCNPIMACWINSVFSKFTDTNLSTIVYYPDVDIEGKEFNSNVFAAYDRNFLSNELQFPDVNYAEDMIYAKLLSESSYFKAFKYDAKVKHSHSWDQPINYFQRIFDEHVGLQKATGYIEHSIKLSNLPILLLKNTLINKINVFKSNISFFAKLKWLWKSYPIEYYRLTAVIIAKNYQNLSTEKYNLFSREGMQRNLKLSQLNLLKKIKLDFLIISEILSIFGRLIKAKLDLLKIYQNNFGFITGFVEFIKNKGKDTPTREQKYDFTTYYFDQKSKKDSFLTLNINPDSKKIAWIVPAFGKLSGGMESITRLVTKFTRMGKDCEIFIIPPFYFANEGIAQNIYRKFYLDGKNLNIKINYLTDPSEQLAEFDLVIATEWRTAYYAFHAYTQNIPVVYFVQDFEPMFFPAGAVQSFAEETYKFPYKFITISPWLTKVLTEKYSITEASGIEIGYNPKEYFISKEFTNRENRIAIYARKNTDRRGWELLELILQKIDRQKIKIDLFGIEDDSDIKRIHPGITSHGIIDKKKINEIYNNAKLAITFSYTNYSINPQEMNATGLPVLEIDWEGNRINYKNRVGVKLIQPNPIMITDWINKKFTQDDLELSEINTRLKQELDVPTWESQQDKFFDLVFNSQKTSR